MRIERGEHRAAACFLLQYTAAQRGEFSEFSDVPTRARGGPEMRICGICGSIYSA